MAEPDTLESYMPARTRNPDNMDAADRRDTNPSGGASGGTPVQNPFGGSGSNDGYERFMTLHQGARGTLKSDRKGEMRYISGPYKGMTKGQGDIIANNTFSRMSDQERDRYRPVNAADRAAAAAAEEQGFQKGMEREKIAMRERGKIEAEQRAVQAEGDARKLQEQKAKEEKEAAEKAKEPIVGPPAPDSKTPATATAAAGSASPTTGTTPAPTTASASSSPAAAGAASATTPTVPVAPVMNPAETNQLPQRSATPSPIEGDTGISQAPVMNPSRGLGANSMSQPSFGNRLGTGASQTGNTEKLRQQNIRRQNA